MDHIQDIAATRRLLRRGIEAGYWSLEDLDQPSPGWADNAKRFRVNHPLYVQHEYRNPLRDNPEPVVQRSEPRDFTPSPGETKPQAQDLPISLEEPDW